MAKRPSLHHAALGILALPKGGGASDESEPEMGEGEEDGQEEDYGEEAEHQACKELAEILDVPDDKFEEFSSALSALFDAKMSKHGTEED